MPRLDKTTKDQIKQLDHQSLQQIVLKLTSRDKSAYEYVLVNYIDKEQGEKELFEEVKADLELIFRKQHKGFSYQLQLANMLAKCVKRINEFTKTSNNKVSEAELLMHILKVPFSLNTDMFGTCFTQFDTRVAIILKRLINIVTKKLHEDYLIEYQDTINSYLEILHRTSGHINTVYQLPDEI